MGYLTLSVVTAAMFFTGCGSDHSNQTADSNSQEKRMVVNEKTHLQANVFPDFGYMVSPEEYREKYSDQPLPC